MSKDIYNNTIERLLQILEIKNVTNIKLEYELKLVFSDITYNKLIPTQELFNIIQLLIITYNNTNLNVNKNISNNIYISLIDLSIKYNLIIDQKILYFILLNSIFIDYMITQYYLHNIKFNSEHSQFIISNKLVNNINIIPLLTYNTSNIILATNSHINIIKYILDENIDIPQEYIDTCIYKCFNKLSIFESLVKYLSNKNILFTSLHLEEACFHKNFEIIKIILNQKVNITKKCITNILNNNDFYENEKIVLNNKNIIELLILYGYNITEDDLLQITKLKIELDSNKFSQNLLTNKEFMSKMSDLCNNINFFPYGIKIRITKFI